MCYLPPQDRIRFERGATHLWRLGPRATAEFLAEIADAIGGRPAIARLLAAYETRLSPELLRAVGGDRFPSRRPRAVPDEMRRAAR